MQTFHVKQVPARIGNYLAGFTDGDGSFYVSFQKRHNSKLGWEVRLIFNVSQKEKVILSQFKKHLKCGKIREMKPHIYQYRVENFNAIQTNVIPFFNRFGFLSAKKKRDFSKFQQIAKLMDKKDHLTPEGIQEILKIRKDMNDGGSGTRRYSDEEILESLGGDDVSFKKIPPDLGNYLAGFADAVGGDDVSSKKILPDLGNYLAGFTDAEGCFHPSFRKSKSCKIGWQISLCFNVSQKDPDILSLFKKHLQCGSLRERKHNGIWSYQVESFNDIQTNLIPFFRRFGFLSAKKKRDFSKFQQIAKLMDKKDHLTPEGIQEILKIRKDMNGGDKRKYSDKQILRILRDYMPNM